MSSPDHVIRAVRPDEWRQARELRLLGLQDPAAPVAFLESYEASLAQPDSFWQQRVAERGGQVRQFVAEAPGESWWGSVTVLVEEAGSLDFMDTLVQRRQGHVVGVFVRPEYRGTGLIGELMAAGLAWAWEQSPPLARVRLCVHEGNPRARAAYRRLGFTRTGLVLPFATDTSAKEYEMAVARP
ncbi:GNAT family N-acetyltransferase [Streptomyces sp. NBC_01497]|uniref:GNAT family N-acetyltransferase n=1 Tax=Streptomyces sp. NBC_01497 TaxID=2903885 RepID=UPI002E379C9E|nr:GNAT family N-acetyltransferase [Streptomyces sp. NBC_01497]